MQRIIHREKELLMLRGIFLGLIMLLFLSACAGDATPLSPSATPAPTETSTITASPTIDYAQLTAYATYRPTLVPSFTPTYTPSATGIPSRTPTSTPSPTQEPMSEILLCPGFDVSPFAPAGRELGVSFTIPQNFTLALEIVVAETGVIYDAILAPNRDALTLYFDPAQMPSGEYIWRASLQDETRTGLCAKEGRYTLVALPTSTATQAAGQAPTAANTLSSVDSVRATATALAVGTRGSREPQATNEAGH